MKKEIEKRNQSTTWQLALDPDRPGLARHLHSNNPSLELYWRPSEREPKETEERQQERKQKRRMTRRQGQLVQQSKA